MNINNFNTDEVIKVLESMIYINKEVALETWKSLLLKDLDDIRITKNMLEQFIESYSEGVFNMILNNEESFKKLSCSKDYDVAWLVELAEFLVNVEDMQKILKFIDNSLKTKGNKFAFFKEILESLSFIEYIDKWFVDELLVRISMFDSEMQVLQLKAILLRFI